MDQVVLKWLGGNKSCHVIEEFGHIGPELFFWNRYFGSCLNMDYPQIWFPKHTFRNLVVFTARVYIDRGAYFYQFFSELSDIHILAPTIGSANGSQGDRKGVVKGQDTDDTD